jgi:pimeloyl-ACP methyl ester carboxylesterase
VPATDVAGVRVEYEWIGAPAEGVPDVVLLHEGLGSRAAWRGFPARVAETTGAAVLVFSRAGYGESGPRPGPWPPSFMHDEARRLPALLEALDVRRPVLFGHSDGASIALLHAADHPADVHALVLEAPHVFVEEETVRSIRSLRDAYATSGFRERWRRTQGAHADQTFAAWTDVWLSAPFREWSIRDRLANVRAPALVLQGVNDEYGTLAQVEAIRSGVVGPVDAVILRDCGHAPHRDRSEETLEAVRSFLARFGAG